MNSLGVVIPTRDSMALLPAHLASMRPWLDVAHEIIVVDSDSRDGTVEFLKRSLAGYPVRFFHHPPGLYESWNHGIARIEADFVYISTVGDEISRDGLLGLLAAAERLASDVVISPPAFIDERDRLLHCNQWPIHHILKSIPLREPTDIDPLIAFVLALNFLPFAILGSSASNLYRTALLQRYPFPTDFGNNGDGAWGLFHALHVRLAIFPTCISTFRRHKKSHPDSGTAHDTDGRMLDLGMQEYRSHLQRHPEWLPRVKALELERIFAAKRVVQRWRTQLMDERRRFRPWVLNPFAWRSRRRRQQAQAQCELLVQGLLAASGPVALPQSGCASAPLPVEEFSGEPLSPRGRPAVASEADVGAGA